LKQPRLRAARDFKVSRRRFILRVPHPGRGSVSCDRVGTTTGCPVPSFASRSKNSVTLSERQRVEGQCLCFCSSLLQTYKSQLTTCLHPNPATHQDLFPGDPAGVV